MSFGNILKSLGHAITTGINTVVALEPTVVPVVNLIPGAAAVSATIFGAVTGLESLVQGPNMGAARKAAATAIVNAIHPGLDQPSVSSAIDGLVAFLKALSTAAPATAAAPPATPTVAP